MSESVRVALSIPHYREPEKRGAYILLGAAVGASAGALASHLVSFVHPMAGALYGGVAFLTSTAFEPFQENWRGFNDKTLEKAARIFMDFVVSFGVGWLAVQAFGYTMPLYPSALLALCTVGVSLAAVYIANIGRGVFKSMFA